MKCTMLTNMSTRRAAMERSASLAQATSKKRAAKIETLARALAKEYFTGLGDVDVVDEVDDCWADWEEDAKNLLAEVNRINRLTF